jgi:hypothetical protein
MDSRFFKLIGRRATIVAGSFVIALTGVGAGYGEDPVDTTPAAPPAHRIVLRISDKMLNALLSRQRVDRQADIRDNILGTAIDGTARIVGTPRVKLAESPDQAAFNIVFEGTAYSRTTGYNGPAIIHSRSVTTFTATKQIVFEPGKGFHGSVPRVAAHTETFLEGISSTRGGLMGWIIGRKAAKIEAQQHAEATEIARQKAALRIAAAFERNSAERLARMNWVTELRSVATTALAGTDTLEPKFVCSTTAHYLQIATSFGEGSSPIELPDRTTAAGPGAPVEVWVHESLLGGGNTALLTEDGVRSQNGDLIKAISAAALVLGANSGSTAQLISVIREQPIRMHQVDAWHVIDWHLPDVGSSSTSLAELPFRSSPTPSSHISAPLERTPHAALDAAVEIPERRIWRSGGYTADAEFLSLDGNIVRLRRTNGIRTRIPFAKLSVADQQWIQARLANAQSRR